MPTRRGHGTHEGFAALLLEEVARSLEQELRALDLLKYCRPALEQQEEDC
jgi:hypothetical protein